MAQAWPHTHGSLESEKKTVVSIIWQQAYYNLISSILRPICVTEEACMSALHTETVGAFPCHVYFSLFLRRFLFFLPSAFSAFILFFLSFSHPICLANTFFSSYSSCTLLIYCRGGEKCDDDSDIAVVVVLTSGLRKRRKAILRHFYYYIFLSHSFRGWKTFQNNKRQFSDVRKKTHGTCAAEKEE